MGTDEYFKWQTDMEAARLVSEHLVLRPKGLAFAPHPVISETDRDKYCVQRIVDFYQRHQVDYADYFLAAWKFKHREKLGTPDAELCCVSSEAKLSEKYLRIVWAGLTEGEADAGPLAIIRKMWNDLPAPDPKNDNIARAVRGEKIGTLVAPAETVRQGETQ